MLIGARDALLYRVAGNFFEHRGIIPTVFLIRAVDTGDAHVITAPPRAKHGNKQRSMMHASERTYASGCIDQWDKCDKHSIHAIAPLSHYAAQRAIQDREERTKRMRRDIYSDSQQTWQTCSKRREQYGAMMFSFVSVTLRNVSSSTASVGRSDDGMRRCKFRIMFVHANKEWELWMILGRTVVEKHAQP